MSRQNVCEINGRKHGKCVIYLEITLRNFETPIFVEKNISCSQQNKTQNVNNYTRCKLTTENMKCMNTNSMLDSMIVVE